MNTISLLRTFVAVARGGSFTAGAEQMALTQAAVGQQMRALEAEMKQPLFKKAGRSMALSPAGHRLLPRAEQLLAQYEALRNDVQDERRMAGTIRLGSPITAVGLLSTTMANLKRQHPELEILLRVRDQSRLMQDVVNGELDAALLIEHQIPRTQGLLWTPCYEEVLVAIAHASVATPGTSLASLVAQQPFIRFDRRTQTGARVDRLLQRLRLVPHELLELNSLLAIAELVRQNIGFTIAPLLRNFDWENDPALCVLRLPGRPVARRLGLLEGRQRSHITEVVREAIRVQLGQRRARAR